MRGSLSGFTILLALTMTACGPAVEDEPIAGTGSETGDPCDGEDGCPGEPTTFGDPDESGDDGPADGGESSGGESTGDESSGGEDEPPAGACMLLDKEECEGGGERRCVYGEDPDETWGQWTHCYECTPHDTRQCGDASQWQRCFGNIEPESQPDLDPPMWGECWDLDEVECLPGDSDWCAEDRKSTMWCRIGDDGLPYWDLDCAGD